MSEGRPLSIRIDPELREALEARAEAEGLSLTALVRRALKVIVGHVTPQDLRHAADQLEALQSKENVR